MRWWNWIKEALFPERCILCRREGSWLCQTHNIFEKAPPNEAVFLYVDEIIAATAYYQETSKKLVEYFKFRGFAELADIMAKEIIAVLPIKEDYTLIPIPLHWTRRMWRGFNQAEKLAQSIQKQLPTIPISLNLKRIQRTKQQSKLNRDERLKNVTQVFQWKEKSLVPKNILLIDDVVASGSTMDAAAKELKKQGAQNIIGVVFARGGKPCQNLHDEN